MTTTDRAAAYLDKLPFAIAGQGGHRATFAAACRLVERTGATVVACAFLIELTFLTGRAALEGRRYEALIRY